MGLVYNESFNLGNLTDFIKLKLEEIEQTQAFLLTEYQLDNKIVATGNHSSGDYAT